MEQKLVRVLFDIEMAKRIQNGEVDGKIITRNGYNVRIVCFDAKTNYYPIVAMIADENGEETIITRTIDGKTVPSDTDTDQCNLILEIPEYLTFKDGDVLISRFGNPFIFNGYVDEEKLRLGAYCGIDKLGILKMEGDGTITEKDKWSLIEGVSLATEAEKQKLIDALKESKEPKTKEYLKRFFGIEEKKEYEFKPFDRVLARNSEMEPWRIEIFSHIDKSAKYLSICFKNSYTMCIPYNEQTAHLLGTTDNWEG